MSLNLYLYHTNPESVDGYEQARDTVPAVVWERYIFDRNELQKREYLWAKSAEYSFQYAWVILRGPFKLGEPTIATDAEHSYWYARIILKQKRFKLGEPAIRGSDYQERYEKMTGIKL